MPLTISFPGAEQQSFKANQPVRAASRFSGTNIFIKDLNGLDTLASRATQLETQFQNEIQFTRHEVSLPFNLSADVVVTQHRDPQTRQPNPKPHWTSADYALAGTMKAHSSRHARWLQVPQLLLEKPSPQKLMGVFAGLLTPSGIGADATEFRQGTKLATTPIERTLKPHWDTTQSSAIDYQA